MQNVAPPGLKIADAAQPAKRHVRCTSRREVHGDKPVQAISSVERKRLAVFSIVEFYFILKVMQCMVPLEQKGESVRKVPVAAAVNWYSV